MLNINFIRSKILLNGVGVSGIVAIAVCIAGLASSCRNAVQTYENNLGVRPVVLAQIDTANYTVINWKDSVQDFGIVEEGESLKIKFTFENIGKTGLFVLEARQACGCTNLQYPEGIILPGGKGEVTATFATSGQQAGIVFKKIYVKTNTSNSMQHTLVFKGEIKKKG